MVKKQKAKKQKIKKEEIVPVVKRKIGRPTKYKPEYCQQIEAFFDREIYKMVENEKTTEYYESGAIKKESYKKMMLPNDLPFFNDFANSIGVYIGTLEEWCLVYPEFSISYKKCKEKQKQFLIVNGLNGNSPPAAFIFTAKNLTDMRDEQYLENRHTGSVIIEKKVSELDDEQVSQKLQEKILNSGGKKK